VNGWRPLDSAKHVFFDWKPVIAKRVGHVPAMNPYRFPENKGLRLSYTKEMYPKSIENLGRTVFVSMSPEWTAAEVSTKIRACARAAAAL
jgi:hypothetical protein